MASRNIWKLALLLLMTGCEKFEYNPYQETGKDLPENLNAKNIQRIVASEATRDDTITVVFTGDSQRFYDELENLVSVSNTLPDVDFFVLAGDISDFGLLKEFEWVAEKLSRLNMPYVCVIGNHDLVGKGLDIYRKMFGPENVSFCYKRHKFLLHDTNGREYGFNGKVPNMPWLAAEVEDTRADWYVGICHVPPYDVDFDPALEEGYRLLMANTPGFRLSLHGHLHSAGDSYYYNDDVRYIGSNAVGNDEAVLLKIYEGEVVVKELIEY